MLHALLLTLCAVWLLDGVALLAHPRGVITALRQFVEVQGGVQRWWALTSGLGLVLFWLPAAFPHRSWWILVGSLMLAKGAFLGTAPDRWRSPVLAWCLTREEVDYRFWGLGLCTLAIVLGQNLATMPMIGPLR